MRVLHPQPVANHSISIPIADGTRGIFQTVRAMRALVVQGRSDPNIVEAARLVTLNSTEKDRIGEINALFTFVRDRIRYVLDPVDVETISPAWYTLHFRSGDCDDKAILLASMLEAIGIPAKFVVAGYSDPGVFEHVFVAAEDMDGYLIPMDPTEPQPLGWCASDPMCIWIEK